MAKLVINNDKKMSTIAPEIYGHFSEHLGRCIYEGLYVGEDSDIPNVNGMRTDVVEALKEMKIPVLRWPGGCFADEYHWMDGIGPKASRKKMINTHWGGVVEDNSFGTHEFFELCRQLGCKTYVNGNLGSGTVREMSEWVEYNTFNGVSPMADLRKQNGHEEPWKIDYFGDGNENWGCGGNMRPQHYADEYRRYQTYVRNYAGNDPIAKICCGPNVDDYEWTKKVMETCFDHCEPRFHGMMDGLSLHYYTLPEVEDDWNKKGSATDFTEEIFYQTLKRGYFMDELINRHGAIIDNANAAATVTKVTLITRKAYGGAYIVMSSKPTGADVNLAYPQAEIAVMGAEGAVNILYRKSAPEEKAEIIKEYEDKFSNPYRAAERGLIDEVIMPRDTRYKLIQALEMCHNKNQSNPPKKHGNMPL